MEAPVSSAKEMVEESSKKARRATKGSAVSAKDSSGKDDVSAGYIMVEVEAPVSFVATQDEESAQEAPPTTEEPKASVVAREDLPSGVDTTSMGGVVVAIPKKTPKRAKPVKPMEALPSDADRDSVATGEVVVAAPKKISKHAKPLTAAEALPSSADLESAATGEAVVVVPKKTSKHAKPMTAAEDLRSSADRESATTGEAVVAVPKKTSKHAKPLTAAEDLRSSADLESAATGEVGEAVVAVPKKTSKRAKPMTVAEDGSEAPAPSIAKAISRKSRRSSDTGEDDVSSDVQEPASKKSKAANGEGKAVKKPKMLQLDANGEIVDDRVTPLVNKKGVRDSGKASHPDMKMSPGYIKALELKMHKEVSDAGHRAKVSGRRTWKDIDA